MGFLEEGGAMKVGRELETRYVSPPSCEQHLSDTYGEPLDGG